MIPPWLSRAPRIAKLDVMLDRSGNQDSELRRIHDVNIHI
jgi:hypothetical protein